jgi:NAD(P)-dependent dehydrogenase (short-subunit alcohol dehydrogenase family)
VRDYPQQLAVFDLAFEKHQTIDHAIYIVGIADPLGWMSASKLNLESIKIKPTPLDNVLEVNLKGCLYFARIAMTYMNERFIVNSLYRTTVSKSLILLSSASGFNEAPGLYAYAYASSKAGITGMLRSFRSISLQNFGVSVESVTLFIHFLIFTGLC